MTDTAAPATASSTTPKKVTKKTTKVAKPADHPKYSDMVAKAITDLKDRKGSSSQAIKKYIVSHFKLEEKIVGKHVRLALQRGISSGQLNQVKGTGANGSFKLMEATKPKKEAKEPKSPKKTTPMKKPAAAKKLVSKSPKKAAKKTSTVTAAKKTPTKSPKKSVKKAAKSPAKKPVAKKATKKPAAKKTAAKK